MSELKHCPFCGGEARDSCFPTDYPIEHCRAYVECTECGAEINRDGRVNDSRLLKEQAIEAWNRRPESRQLTLDELRQMDGQPVWVNVLLDDYPGEWALASEFCQGATTGASVFLYGNYGEVWLAYDQPPGGYSGQWIPVIERLPDVRHYPPVICGHDKDNWTDAAIVKGQGKFINSDGCEIFPTHWMPLPEPPGGDRL